MTEISLKSWEDYEERITGMAPKSGLQGPLFRGQRKACWALETTLERYSGLSENDTRRYLNAVECASRAIETVTGKKYDIEKVTSEMPEEWRIPDGYAAMAYLRQNGFPSPLLDWSRSPYVAAFFAFHNADAENTESVAIFEYIGDAGNGKTATGGEPSIDALGPWIATDRKHFLQQSEYTVCRVANERGRGVCYVSHERVFTRTDNLLKQDLLTKVILPVSEKSKVMARLKLMNITAYSLYETTQALMEILAPEILGEPQSKKPSDVGCPSIYCVNGTPVTVSPLG